MSKNRSVIHHSFTVERTFPQTPTTVYLAFGKQDRRKRWFVFPDDRWRMTEQQFNFYPNCRDVYVAHPPAELQGAPMITYDAYYYEMPAFERIVYSYQMHHGTDLISVSLVTIELHPEGNGTRLVYTEQGTYLDGHESPDLRMTFISALLDRLRVSLGSA